MTSTKRATLLSTAAAGRSARSFRMTAGRQYLLSNNHVLARSDHASVGDTIVQPGLIDNNCTPNGDGPGTFPLPH